MFTHHIAKYYFPAHQISTDNFNIACEMLADSYIPFAVNENEQIVFPTAAATIKVVAESPKVASAATQSDAKPASVPATQPVPAKCTKQPVFALIGAKVNTRTVAELKRFLGENAPKLSVTNKTYYEKVLAVIQSEIKKPIAERLTDMFDIIEMVETGKTVAEIRKPLVSVSMKMKELTNNQTSVFCEFSETVIDMETGKELKRLYHDRKLYTKPRTKFEREWNQTTMIYLDGWDEMMENKINNSKGYARKEKIAIGN